MITDITKKPEHIRVSAAAAEDQSVPLTRAESFRVYTTLSICFGIFVAMAFYVCN